MRQSCNILFIDNHLICESRSIPILEQAAFLQGYQILLHVDDFLGCAVAGMGLMHVAASLADRWKKFGSYPLTKRFGLEFIGTDNKGE